MQAVCANSFPVALDGKRNDCDRVDSDGLDFSATCQGNISVVSRHSSSSVENTADARVTLPSYFAELLEYACDESQAVSQYIRASAP